MKWLRSLALKISYCKLEYLKFKDIKKSQGSARNVHRKFKECLEWNNNSKPRKTSVWLLSMPSWREKLMRFRTSAFFRKSKKKSANSMFKTSFKWFWSKFKNKTMWKEGTYSSLKLLPQISIFLKYQTSKSRLISFNLSFQSHLESVNTLISSTCVEVILRKNFKRIAGWSPTKDKLELWKICWLLSKAFLWLFGSNWGLSLLLEEVMDPTWLRLQIIQLRRTRGINTLNFLSLSKALLL